MRKRPNRFWRVDEIYVKVADNWAYLYRAVDSAGETIEFMLSPKRDLTAATLFLRLALKVDGHPAYANAIAELKESGELGRRCNCRTSPYLNNSIEQDHRFIKKRITASVGFRSADGAWRTIEGYEAMHAIRKGQLRWVGKPIPSLSGNSSTQSWASLPSLASCLETTQPRPRPPICSRTHRST